MLRDAGFHRRMFVPILRASVQSVCDRTASRVGPGPRDVPAADRTAAGNGAFTRHGKMRTDRSVRSRGEPSRIHSGSTLKTTEAAFACVDGIEHRLRACPQEWGTDFPNILPDGAKRGDGSPSLRTVRDFRVYGMLLVRANPSWRSRSGPSTVRFRNATVVIVLPIKASTTSPGSSSSSAPCPALRAGRCTLPREDPSDRT